jgi:hypothetical protein
VTALFFVCVSRAARLGALWSSKEQGTRMKMKMITFGAVLALVGCGGLHEAPDLGGATPVGEATAGTSSALGGSGPLGSAYGGGSATAGTSAEGGYETGGTGFEGGGYEAGGYATGGTGFEGGGYEAGGYASGGTGFAGTPAGGYESGGTGYGGGWPVGGASEGGTGSSLPDDWTCLQNVSHCFNAAANCYEYSPWSDCDQIVDVCSAMQDSCDAASP